MTYNAGVETIYDIAVKLYAGAVDLGLADLIPQNQSLNLNASIAGSTVNFTYGIKRTTQQLIANQKVIPILVANPVYRVGESQSIYDLACQIFGNVSQLGLIIPFVSDLNSEITPGTGISYSPPDDPMAVYFYNTAVIVSTFVLGVPANVRLLEDGSFRLLEDGSYRLLE
jgi:hypothetical protein